VSKDLFGSVNRTADRNRSASRGTLGVSFAVHAIIVAVIIAAPIVAPIVMPVPYDAVAAFNAPAPVPTAPPPPAPPRPPDDDKTGDTSTVPVHAPDRIADEITHVPSVAAGIIGGITCEPATQLPSCPGGGIVGGIDLTPGPAAPIAPPPPAIHRVGGVIRPPEKIQHVNPVYPVLARSTRTEGLVILEAIIAPDGTIRDLRTLKAHPLLEAAAVDAVRQWRYRPTLLNGVPVAVVMTVTMTFQLQ
jgi:periplasmic protein TonB